MNHQREEVRREMHATIDRLINDWPDIARLADSPTLGGESRGGSSSEAERKAGQVARLASIWVARLERLRCELRNLDAIRSSLAVVGEQGVTRGRANTVEPCALCNLPPAPKAKRIDGKPYCANTCYFKVWRSLKDDEEQAS